MANPGPQFRHTFGCFGQQPYEEWSWMHGDYREIRHHISQVNGTFVYHAITHTMDYNYWISYHQHGMNPPFRRLSVEHLKDQVEGVLENYGNTAPIDQPRPRDIAFNVVQNHGIKANEYYSGPEGLRGENNWVPSPDAENLYRVQSAQWWCMPQLNASHDVKYDAICEELKNGPVFLEFFAPRDYHLVRNYPHPGGASQAISHCVMAVGHGRFMENGVVKNYIKYFNTHGLDWGDGGIGRLVVDNMACIWGVWIPKVPEPQHPAPPSSSAPNLSASGHSG